MQRTGALLGALALAASLVPVPALAFRCSDGSESHTATAQEAASVQDGSIIAGTTQVCPGDAQSGVSGDAGAAKQYLLSLKRTGSAADPSNIDQLNSAFAICAANFLKAYQGKYGPVTITSAYRSPAYDAKMCVNNTACGALMNNPNPNGNHQKGLAIDVHPDNESMYSTIWSFASANPQFGVCFPFQDGKYTGFQDRPHMILAGIQSNEVRGCVAQGITQACQAGHFDPNSVNPATAGPVQTPTSPLASAVRQYLGGATPTPSPSSNIPASSQPFSYAQPTSGVLPAPSVSIPAPSGIPAAGGSVTTAQPVTSVIPVDVAQPGNVSDQLVAPSAATGTSAFDLLNSIAYPTSTAIATGSPLALNSSLYQETAGTAQDQGSTPIPQIAPGSVSTLTPGNGQTFTSDDLQYSDTGWNPPADSSFLQATLGRLQQALLQVLAWARPFGSLAPQPLDEENVL